MNSNGKQLPVTGEHQSDIFELFAMLENSGFASLDERNEMIRRAKDVCPTPAVDAWLQRKNPTKAALQALLTKHS